MRQFMIDRAGTLYYEARQFPQTWRVAVNWICRALYIAKQTGDMDLYRQILHANDPRSDESQEDDVYQGKRKRGLEWILARF